MHTKLFRKNFPTVYEEFFQQHELVYSCPLVTNRTGDVLGNFAGIPMSQKLPLRIYVGLAHSGELQLGNATYFDPQQEQFYTEPLSTHHHLGKKFFDRLKEDINIHARVDILVEGSQSLGLGFTSIFSLLLIIATNNFSNGNNINKLDEELHQNIQTILQDQTSETNNILLKTITLEAATGRSARLTPKITSLFHGAGPIISFREDNEKKSNPREPTIHHTGFRSHELRPQLDPFSELNGDFVIFYTGKPLTKERVEESYAQKTDFRNIQIDLLETMQQYCSSMNQDRKPKFYKQLLEDTQHNVLSRIYGQMMGSVSIELVYLMKNFLSHYSCDTDTDNLIYGLNKFKSAHSITRVSSKEYIKLLETIEHFFFSIGKNPAVFPIESTISGGCIGIFAHREQIKRHIESMLDYCRTNQQLEISIVYQNWVDGYEQEGLRVEQDINNNILSEFSKRMKHRLTNRDGSVQLIEYSNGIQNNRNEITLDTIKNKIYILGEPCTSKNLHSQSTTIDLLGAIIKNKGAAISSKDLPVSSYTKKKSDMITKVIQPLEKLVKEKLNKILSIKCIGYTSHYNIESNISNIKVGTLQQI